MKSVQLSTTLVLQFLKAEKIKQLNIYNLFDQLLVKLFLHHNFYK